MLTEINKNLINNDKITLTSNSIIISDETTIGELEPILSLLKTVSNSNSFWVGDYCIAVQSRTGNDHSAEVSEITNLDMNTLRHYKATCQFFPPETRNPRLSFKHHFNASKELKSVKEATEWLNRAERESLSASQMRTSIREARREYLPDDSEQEKGIAELLRANLWAKRQISEVNNYSEEWARNLLSHVKHLRQLIKMLEARNQ